MEDISGKFHPEDNPAWKDPGIDDGKWLSHCFSEDIKNISGRNWSGPGWFRCRFFIDETLRGRMAAVYISHLGASEIYLNGKLIHKTGPEADNPPAGQSAHNKEWKAFIFDNNPVQVIAVGNATGHGMKAGIMVAAAKSLFRSIGTGNDMSGFFNACTDTIKQMHMGNMYMAMTLVRIKDRKLTASAAGMPPLLIFRGSDKKVEEIKIKGPPL